MNSNTIQAVVKGNIEAIDQGLSILKCHNK